MENARKDIVTVYLKKEISKLIKRFPQIKEIYLFGSRAYRTNSIRSDIDLLLYCSEPIALHEEPEICDKSVDLFDTTSFQHARSYSNNSMVSLRQPFTNIIAQLDAILLWSSESGFKNDNIIKYNRQIIIKNANFIKSVLEYVPSNKNKNIPTIELGEDIPRFLQLLAENITISIENIKQLKTTKAKNIICSKLILNDEYDFQNFIFLVCKPWLHDLEKEPFVIKSNGIERRADFGLSDNKIIIEAKHIKDTNTKNKIIKEFEGIKKYYKENPAIVGILFLVLYDSYIDIDKAKFLEPEDSQIYVHFIENKRN